jgi:hypothetical protein
MLALAGLANAESTISAPAAAPKAQTPAALAEARVRLSEMNVAIAWLSDPLLFPSSLTARSLRAAMIEVSGAVPSPEAHVRALQVARDHSDVAIIDAITIHADKKPPVAVTAGPRLNLEVTKALTEPALRGLRDLEVQESNGEVAVLGSVASYEEKLAASQRLQHLAGCRCVLNRLTVQPQAMANSNGSWCAVTADGHLLVPAEMAPPLPPTPFHSSVSLPNRNDPQASLIQVKAAPEKSAAPPTPAADTGVKRALFQLRSNPPAVAAPAGNTAERAATPSVVSVSHTVTATDADGKAANLQEWYRQRIAKECGLEPNRVSVKLTGKSDMTVALALPDPRAASRLAARIMRLPELASYQVKIELPVAK